MRKKTKGQIEEKQLPAEQRWENLQASNDFIFAKLMRNKELCKGVLERLLSIKIERIEYPEEQKVIDISQDSKSVRLDVYVKDGRGTVYNIEIQTTDTKELPKRSRYYQSMIDLNAIEKGASYKKLPQSFVIFICTFDPFNKGRHKYTFRNVCKEDRSLTLDDGTTKVFFNTKGVKGRIHSSLRAFLDFIDSSKAEDDFTRRMEQEVKKIKENKEWRVEYMTLLMREREKYEDGLERGEIKGTISFALDLDYSNDQIVSVLQRKFKMTEEQAQECLADYYNNSP